MQQQQRRNRVRWALRVAAGTALSPGLQERRLLAHYIRGTLSLDDIITLLEKHPGEPGNPPAASELSTAPPTDYVF